MPIHPEPLVHVNPPPLHSYRPLKSLALSAIRGPAIPEAVDSVLKALASCAAGTGREVRCSASEAYASGIAAILSSSAEQVSGLPLQTPIKGALMC